ncbi:MAG: aspartate aminotransferase family protein [candidate division NC10 bacterium]|nr:aspartate aminotransferase family protein [candidate division NC10 bacterium]
MTPESDARFATEEYLRHIMLDYRQMTDFVKEPFLVARADGIRFWDVHGKEYLDGLAGIFVVNVGYNNPRMLEAVRRQLETLPFNPPMHGTNPRAVELASLLAEITPGDLNTARLVSSGSEATEAAFKMARQYHRQTGNPGKYKILSRYLSYHGATGSAMSAGGVGYRKTLYEPAAVGFLHTYPPYCYRCPYEKTYPSCEVFCARTIRSMIEWEDPWSIAAIIVEPISNTGGIITPPTEYLGILRQLCDEHDILLIFDEIITGFGRTGGLFAANTFDVVPDILCCGKGMSSGYAPLAAALVRDKVAATFWGAPGTEFAHGHTFAGNPVSCAAGLASIREILERRLPENARRVGAHLVTRLEGLRSLGIIGDIRGKGLMIGVEFVQDPVTKQQFAPGINIGLRIGKRALHHGLLLRFDPHWIAFAPPLIVTERDIDTMVNILERSIQEVLREL